MSLLDKLERRLGFLAIQNLTLYIVVGQALTFLMFSLLPLEGKVEALNMMMYSWAGFLEGYFWNPISFILIPKTFSLLWIFFALMVLHMMGSALEEHWGAFRYNLYVAIGVVLIVASGWIQPYHQVTSYFLLTSILLAFAYKFPEVELSLFFVLPVKMRWLGLAIAALTAYLFFRGSAQVKIEIVASLANFPMFFGWEIISGIRSRKRALERKAERAKLEAEPFHVCGRCGATDKSHPERDFRYRKEGCICSVCLEEEQEGDG